MSRDLRSIDRFSFDVLVFACDTCRLVLSLRFQVQGREQKALGHYLGFFRPSGRQNFTEWVVLRIVTKHVSALDFRSSVPPNTLVIVSEPRNCASDLDKFAPSEHLGDLFWAAEI